MSGGAPPLVVCVAGRRGAGKTRLLERIVPVLIARGIRVGYLRFGERGDDRDPGTADADRMRRVGAVPVGSATDPGKVPVPGGGNLAARAALWNLRALHPEIDLLLVEGMTGTSHPRLVIDGESHRSPGPGSSPDPAAGPAADPAPGPAADPAAGPAPLLRCRLPGLGEPWDGLLDEAVRFLSARLEAPARRGAADLIGCILAGGASRRMGRDKARLPVRGTAVAGPGVSGGSTWLERAFLLVSEVVDPVWICGRSIGADRADLPSLRGSVLSHLDLRPACGPLGGLETALRLAAGKGVLAVPCDLPRLQPEALEHLLAARRRDRLATAFRGADGRQGPSVLILEALAGEPLERYLDAGGRRAGEFLDQVGAAWVEIPPSLEPSLENCNTPDDLERTRRAHHGA